jgi:hypothetical protein
MPAMSYRIAGKRAFCAWFDGIRSIRREWIRICDGFLLAK